jgi:hypothetical protein
MDASSGCVFVYVCVYGEVRVINTLQAENVIFHLKFSKLKIFSTICYLNGLSPWKWRAHIHLKPGNINDYTVYKPTSYVPFEKSLHQAWKISVINTFHDRPFCSISINIHHIEKSSIQTSQTSYVTAFYVIYAQTPPPPQTMKLDSVQSKKYIRPSSWTDNPLPPQTPNDTYTQHFEWQNMQLGTVAIVCTNYTNFVKFRV